MIYYHANDFASRQKKLDGRYYYFKKYSSSPKSLNLVFLSIKKKCTIGEMILISTNIIVGVLILTLILLSIIFIFAIKYRFTNI